jgi:isochorismate hydrolase
MQTVLDALEKNYVPIVVQDAVSSISKIDKEIAINRMLSEKAVVVSTEMLLFELIKDAIHPDFKEISNLVKSR